MPIPRTEAELEDLLSTPSQELVDDLSALDGDLVVLGAGGKVGPTLCLMAQRALDRSGGKRQVVAVSRWSEFDVSERLEAAGVRVVRADLADPANYAALPEAGAVVFMVGNKFGTTGREHLTWWMNAAVPALAASRYRKVPTLVYSSGNVYPFVKPVTGGCQESDPVGPVGVYAQSCLAREQMYVHASATWDTPVSIFRLNYAVELRYGVLADIATDLVAGRPIDVTMGAVNVVWQRAATEWSLRSLTKASTDVFILNGAGPETVSTRRAAIELAARLGVSPAFIGQEADVALISNAGLAHSLYGYPEISVDTAIDWVAAWIATGGKLLGKATKFQRTDGRF